MSDLLDRIDAAVDGLCPCGAQPREGSAYCGPDCEPTHISDDTEAPACETARLGEDYSDPRYAPPTPMRWRPDLVSVADDTDLTPLGSETHGYTGRFNAQVYERAADPTTWHLRLDDGNLFVGCDLRDVGGRQDPISIELVGRVREAWQRLERKLTDTRDMIPDEDDDPWADVMPALPSRGAAVTPVRPPDRYSIIRPSYHNPPPAMDLTLGRAMQQVGRTLVQVGTAAEAFLREVGVELTEWQKQMLAQMAPVQVIVPRRYGLSAWWEAQVRALGFRPLVNARDAAALERIGMREGEHFLRYADAPAADPDDPPTDPMARALWLKRRRNTGPASDRLDGRRRRRR